MAVTAEVGLFTSLYEGPMVALGLTSVETGETIQKNHVLGAMITGLITGWLLGINRALKNPSVAWYGF